MAGQAALATDEAFRRSFVVIHPLDDAPEQKRDTSRLGPIPMTFSVRASLMALRAYLIVMTLLVIYHAMDLAGFFPAHAGY
jgi:hypothetical protein